MAWSFTPGNFKSVPSPHLSCKIQEIVAAMVWWHDGVRFLDKQSTWLFGYCNVGQQRATSLWRSGMSIARTTVLYIPQLSNFWSYFLMIGWFIQTLLFSDSFVSLVKKFSLKFILWRNFQCRLREGTQVAYTVACEIIFWLLRTAKSLSLLILILCAY